MNSHQFYPNNQQRWPEEQSEEGLDSQFPQLFRDESIENQAPTFGGPVNMSSGPLVDQPSSHGNSDSAQRVRGSMPGSPGKSKPSNAQVKKAYIDIHDKPTHNRKPSNQGPNATKRVELNAEIDLIQAQQSIHQQMKVNAEKMQKKQ